LAITALLLHAKSIPLPFTVANGCQWLFGVGRGSAECVQDINMYVPNRLGLAFGIAQGTLKLIYGDHGVNELAIIIPEEMVDLTLEQR
jgi:hypothetical protein